MTDRFRPTRRTVLRTGSALAAAGLVGITSAQRPDRKQDSPDTLRLVSDVDVDGTAEVDAEDTWAYVATGDGFAVVDWRNPNRPQKVVDQDAPGSAIADVKVDGSLLAVSTQDEEHDDDGHEGGHGDVDPDAEIGTHFYDVSDPTDPQYLSTFQVLPAGVHNAHLVDDIAYICKEAPFDDSALFIVDVSDPTDPTELAEWRVEDAHPELDQPTNFVHDVYTQGDYSYLAYWDAGTRVLDVSDPANPVEVSAFGEAPDADEDVPNDFSDPAFVQRVYGLEGNAHYVQPSPDGNHVYVGAETYIGESGGIKVFDVTDFDDPEQVARIAAKDRNDSVFADTSHNFDVTNNRLYTSWYQGGARVYDITDPSNPVETYEYDPEGANFWTTIRERGFILAGDIDSGIVFLHENRGEKRPPSIEGADSVPHHGRKRQD